MITLSSPPVSLSYVSSGLFVAHDEWIHADRVIDSWELIYMLNGAVYMRQADVSYTLEKGDLLLLRPGVPHGGVQSSPPGVSFYWVHFLVSDAAAMARFPTHMAFADGYRFTPLFKQLLHIAGAPSPYPFHAADLAVGLILAQAAASSADDMPQAALLKDCAEWIRINSDRRITVAMAPQRSVSKMAGHPPETIHRRAASAIYPEPAADLQLQHQAARRLPGLGKRKPIHPLL